MSNGTADIALSYIITSSPRTGSYLLCEGLQATGIAGLPTEPFCSQYREEFCRVWRLPPNPAFPDFLRTVKQQCTTSNGVFGVKVHWIQLQTLIRESGFPGRCDGVLEHLFPGAKYIHLKRRDRRAQAISYFRALATNEWWRIEGVRNHQITGTSPAFDSTAIRFLASELESQQLAWRRLFASNKLQPLIIEYEDLAENYRVEIGRALSYLGLSPTAAETIPPPRLLPQADETTDLWRDWLDAEDCGKEMTPYGRVSEPSA